MNVDFEQFSTLNPAHKVKPNKKVKDILEADEYSKLMSTPCINYEVKKAFVFSLYTGFRWVDVKPLKWENIKTTRIINILQKKTGEMLNLPLHPAALKMLGERKTGLIFHLPTADGVNKILAKCCDDAKLDKHITWHCARHSFSVLLLDKGTDVATVAGMLGHTSTKYGHKTYKRYRRPNALVAINKLPELQFTLDAENIGKSIKGDPEKLQFTIDDVVFKPFYETYRRYSVYLDVTLK